MANTPTFVLPNLKNIHLLHVCWLSSSFVGMRGYCNVNYNQHQKKVFLLLGVESVLWCIQYSEYSAT
jgi:hypothetical protein